MHPENFDECKASSLTKYSKPSLIFQSPDEELNWCIEKDSVLFLGSNVFEMQMGWIIMNK